MNRATEGEVPSNLGGLFSFISSLGDFLGDFDLSVFRGTDFQEFCDIVFLGGLQVICSTTVVRDIKSNFFFQRIDTEHAGSVQSHEEWGHDANNPSPYPTMKLALLSALVGSAAAFAPVPVAKTTTAVSASPLLGDGWDPMGFSKMHEINGAFPGMFPHPQFLEEAEIKHGRMSMLAWTGVWATSSGLHFPGAPVADDWATALPVWAREDPGGFGAILLFIMIAEGEGVSHAGDNFLGKSKKVPGDMGFDWMGMTQTLSEEKQARYKSVERENGRAAMIAMASLFALKAIPGSVPLMDILGSN